MSTEVEELEAAIRAGDVPRGLRAAGKLMEEAEAEADLAATSTAINSNLAKLDEIKALRVELDRAESRVRQLEEALKEIEAVGTHEQIYVRRGMLDPHTGKVIPPPEGSRYSVPVFDPAAQIARAALSSPERPET